MIMLYHQHTFPLKTSHPQFPNSFISTIFVLKSMVAQRLVQNSIEKISGAESNIVMRQV